MRTDLRGGRLVWRLAVVCGVLGLVIGGAAAQECWRPMLPAIPCEGTVPGYPRVVDVVSVYRCVACQDPCGGQQAPNYKIDVYYGTGKCHLADDGYPTCTSMSQIGCCPNPPVEGWPCDYYHSQ